MNIGNTDRIDNSLLCSNSDVIFPDLNTIKNTPANTFIGGNVVQEIVAGYNWEKIKYKPSVFFRFLNIVGYATRFKLQNNLYKPHQIIIMLEHFGNMGKSERQLAEKCLAIKRKSYRSNFEYIVNDVAWFARRLFEKIMDDFNSRRAYGRRYNSSVSLQVLNSNRNTTLEDVRFNFRRSTLICDFTKSSALKHQSLPGINIPGNSKKARQKVWNYRNTNQSKWIIFGAKTITGLYVGTSKYGYPATMHDPNHPEFGKGEKYVIHVDEYVKRVFSGMKEGKSGDWMNCDERLGQSLNIFFENTEDDYDNVFFETNEGDNEIKLCHPVSTLTAGDWGAYNKVHKQLGVVYIENGWRSMKARNSGVLRKPFSFKDPKLFGNVIHVIMLLENLNTVDEFLNEQNICMIPDAPGLQGGGTNEEKVEAMRTSIQNGTFRFVTYEDEPPPVMADISIPPNVNATNYRTRQETRLSAMMDASSTEEEEEDVEDYIRAIEERVERGKENPDQYRGLVPFTHGFRFFKVQGDDYFENKKFGLALKMYRYFSKFYKILKKIDGDDSVKDARDELIEISKNEKIKAEERIVLIYQMENIGEYLSYKGKKMAKNDMGERVEYISENLKMSNICCFNKKILDIPKFFIDFGLK